MVLMVKIEKSLLSKETKGISKTMSTKNKDKSLEGVLIAALAYSASSFLKIVLIPFPKMVLYK